MAEFNQKEFHKLLNQAIGDDTKTEFAEKLGISRPYLQKLLGKEVYRPSKDVVAKIAGCSQGRVSSFELMYAAGYTETDMTAGQLRVMMSDQSWINANLNDVRGYIQNIRAVRPFDAEEVQASFHMIFDGTGICEISFREPKDYSGFLKPAENVVLATFRWESERQRRLDMKVYAVLYGHYSAQGDFYVTTGALKQKFILDAFPDMEPVLRAEYESNGMTWEDVQNKPFVSVKEIPEEVFPIKKHKA